jgi:hypothetical protein
VDGHLSAAPLTDVAAYFARIDLADFGDGSALEARVSEVLDS